MGDDVDTEFKRAHRLIKRGDLAGVRRALENGLSPNFENRFGWTLLMLAAIEGNVAIGQLLIERGADINRLTSMGSGQNALSLAIIGGHVKFLKLLLENSADPDTAGAMETWLSVLRLSPKTEAAILETIKDYRARNSN
jgi:ankyrin repeat protein